MEPHRCSADGVLLSDIVDNSHLLFARDIYPLSGGLSKGDTPIGDHAAVVFPPRCPWASAGLLFPPQAAPISAGRRGNARRSFPPSGRSSVALVLWRPFGHLPRPRSCPPV